MNVELSAELVKRQEFSRTRVAVVKERLIESGAADILGDAGAVYATGSMARGDASSHSDLDAFIISLEVDGKRVLSKLDSIRLKSKLIDVVRAESLPDFSEDGKFLSVHTIDEMLAKLGTSYDDYENLFTARMLLLLESVPLLGEQVYEGILRRVVEKYWTDYQGNESDFLPVFLTNDIIRYWKVLCLNYEAFTHEEPLSKRRHQNYKLKFSRLLTCYSAIIYLLMIAKRNDCVTPVDALELAANTPLERLVSVSRELGATEVDRIIRDMLEMYEEFLMNTAAGKEQVRARFEDSVYNKERRAEARAFGDKMFELMRLVGGETRLYRYLVV